jgi:hypothetical protein
LTIANGTEIISSARRDSSDEQTHNSIHAVRTHHRAEWPPDPGGAASGSEVVVAWVAGHSLRRSKRPEHLRLALCRDLRVAGIAVSAPSAPVETAGNSSVTQRSVQSAAKRAVGRLAHRLRLRSVRQDSVSLQPASVNACTDSELLSRIGSVGPEHAHPSPCTSPGRCVFNYRLFLRAVITSQSLTVWS